MKVKHGTLDIPNDPTPWVRVSLNSDKTWCVLWLQGWTSTIEGHLEGIKRMSQATSVTFAMLDYAGHGTHPKSLDVSTRDQQYHEVIAAFDELKRLGYKKIIVIGGSFGSYMAALLCGVRQVNVAILRAPANYPDNEFQLQYQQTSRHRNYATLMENKKFLDPKANNMALQSIRNFDGFVYVMEHELDEIVPKILPQSYFEVAQHGNYLIVPKTKHSPKLMKNPKPHFKYIEHMLVSIIKAVKLGTDL